MTPLTSKERMARILKHQPVDRIGLFEVFWRETAEQWSAEGHFEKPEMISDHFGLDLRRELETKLPGAMAGSGYVLQVDHSVSNLVEYKTYRFFVEQGLKLGRYP